MEDKIDKVNVEASQITLRSGREWRWNCLRRSRRAPARPQELIAVPDAYPPAGPNEPVQYVTVRLSGVSDDELMTADPVPQN